MRTKCLIPLAWPDTYHGNEIVQMRFGVCWRGASEALLRSALRNVALEQQGCRCSACADSFSLFGGSFARVEALVLQITMG